MLVSKELIHFWVIARLFRQILASGHKAELLQQGIQFSSLGIFINKKIRNQKD